MRVNQRNLKNLLNSNYFSDEELEKLGVLQEENFLVSGIIDSNEMKLFSKYCFENDINRSEILRSLVIRSLHYSIELLELSKQVTKIEQKTKITFLVPCSQKKAIKEFVQKYKLGYKMTESLLIRLSIIAFLKEINVKGVII